MKHTLQSQHRINLGIPKEKASIKHIELTDEEIELIDDALTWFWKETMDWFDAEAKKYNGYDPAGCREITALTETAVRHYKVGELMSKFDDYLEDVKGKDKVDEL